MRTFDIYSNRVGARKAVKRGWSWPAFFFSWIWGLLNRLWLAAFLVFPVEIFLNVIANVLDRDTYAPTDPAVMGVAISVVVIFLGLRLLFGAKGNAWRRAKLEKNGFVRIHSTQAGSPKEALTALIHGGWLEGLAGVA